ncbi:hypothetical protein PLESTB_001244400 [Pleodorina starrii]|uniref:Uncharacterized protein n=1 Tax=Pleodorina starrii TaxID=330485 RepID=A0A9W6F5U9_9CHLO|nr:hypothetical protein PLESTM_000215400 [Pleodorina starrii]GLC57597.1 hypothetical protein PLESTB_001244400 [Pleodorina starrii]GLC63267.1 hypothetical protein PLESTF_000018200 [Pleodorina starrii]
MVTTKTEEPANGAGGVVSSIRGALAGPIAGVCSRFITYPPDTIKARLQVQGAAIHNGQKLYTGTWNAVVQVAQHEGLPGFYRGFGAVALGSVPANLAYFGGYEAAKALVPAGWGMLGDMAVGAGAQLLAGLVFTPVDIVKERLQVAPLMRGAYSYSGPGQAVRELIRQNGLRGLLKGYWATNAVWLPWNTIFIAAYEGSKRAAARAGATQATARDGRPGDAAAAAGEAEMHAASEAAAATSSSTRSGSSEEELSPLVLGICSAGSASLAGVLTHPADVVKTRLQVLSACQAHARTTAWSLAVHMWRTEGPKVFMTGLGARIIQLAPGTALSWVIYEPIKKVLAPPHP